jgi:hypothetical protein
MKHIMRAFLYLLCEKNRKMFNMHVICRYDGVVEQQMGSFSLMMPIVDHYRPTNYNFYAFHHDEVLLKIFPRRVVHSFRG